VYCLPIPFDPKEISFAPALKIASPPMHKCPPPRSSLKMTLERLPRYEIATEMPFLLGLVSFVTSQQTRYLSAFRAFCSNCGFKSRFLKD
jgi:hypothetical protein